MSNNINSVNTEYLSNKTTNANQENTFCQKVLSGQPNANFI